MNRLPELIAAYLAMDQFARNIIVESAKTYAISRPYSSARGKLRPIPSPLNYHPSSDSIRDTQEKCLVGVDGSSVDEK
jgi:hypothetical protein